ncbi:MAG: DUF6036 family nucleotidyltransferase [Dokdonella sp.]
MTDVISGVLGELSSFDETFGYHADGVDMQTAKLPAGWRDRLIAIDNPNTNGYVGLCLDLHDLLLSKYAAGRDKDAEFCQAVVHARLANKVVLLDRLQTMDIAPAVSERMVMIINADFAG